MTARRLASLLTAVAVVLISFWWLSGGRGAASEGELLITWSGSHAGSARLPASVAWCPATREARLEAISADTGLMVTLLEVDSIVAELHPVVAPRLRVGAPRPGAIAAFRWVQDTTAIHGFRSTSGLFNITTAGPRLSGSFDFQLVHAVASDTLIARGDFLSVPVVSGSAACQ